MFLTAAYSTRLQVNMIGVGPNTNSKTNCSHLDDREARYDVVKGV